MARKSHPLVILDNELDIIRGGFSWGASNPGAFKKSDGILDVTRGGAHSVILGADGNDFLEGGLGNDF